MPPRTPPAGRRTRLAVERLDERVNPAAPTLLNSTPIALSGAGSTWDYSDGGSFTPSPVFANIDGQAGEELITVTGDRKVAAYKSGSVAPINLLRTFDTGANAPELHTSPLVVTIPGVGPAVFVGGMDGRVFGWNAATGAALPGWPSTVDVPDTVYPLGNSLNKLLGHLGAGDLDGDGVPEVVAVGYNQQVTALRADGSLMWRFSNDDTVLSGVAVGDLDRDGKSEVVFGGDASQNAVYDAGGNVTALTGDGRRKWVKHIDQIGQSAPVLADVRGDGKLEVFAGTGINFTDLNGVRFPGNAVYGLDPDGNDLPGWPYATAASGNDARTPSPPAVADLDGDGQFEVVIGDYSGALQAVHADGRLMWRTQAYPGSLFAAPVIADVTGDGRLDVVQLSNVRARAFDGATGAQNWEYIDVGPGVTSQYLNSPAVGQFRGNGSTQLALLANGLSNSGPPLAPSYLRFFDLPATSAPPAWSSARHDASADAVARPAAFATNYVNGLATYLGRDANGAAGLVAAFRDPFRVAANLTPLTDAILGSVEGRSKEVRRWYALYLGRTADQAGVDNWVAYLGTGRSFAQGQALLLQSQEAFDKSGPTGPASATNQTWVSSLYRTVLGRSPGGGEDSGWVNALNAGRLLRSDVAISFLLSAEYTQALVRGWYATYRLGNSVPAADTLAAASWDLRRGLREETVLSRLFTQGLAGTSSDYLVTHPEGSWLRALYQDVLARPLGVSDAVYWLGQMESGVSYAGVANAVVRSPEHNTQVVQGYFTRYLRRASPPPAASVAGFTARLNAGERRESVIASILASDEYFRLAGGTQNGFIFAAYADLLGPGRQPDANDLAYYANRPNYRGELPLVVMSSDEYAFATIKERFYLELRRYPNTPSNLSSLLNATPAGGDVYSSVRGFIDFLKAGGQQADVELAILTSPEYLAVARTRAFWTGTRWKV